MRVDVYAEEITDRIEIIEKQGFTGIRFYLELPVSLSTPPPTPRLIADIYDVCALSLELLKGGPFVHHPGDHDSSAVTLWGKRDVRAALRKALELLDVHYMDKGGAQ